jgi:hypothetical protein
MNRKVAIIWAIILALSPITIAAQDVGDRGTTSPDAMSDFALFAAIGVFVIPYVAAAINRLHWPDYVRFGTFFIFAVIYAAGDAYFTRTFDWHNWSRAALIVVFGGILFYNANKGAIRAFEYDTTPASARVP